jgi:acyl carrier protein
MMESDTLVLRRHLPLLGAYIAPQTPTEKKLAEIWCRELGMDMVGIADSYEDLGGSSLLAAVIFAEINTTFGIEIPMYSLVDAPTIEQLARQIDRLRQGGGS